MRTISTEELKKYPLFIIDPLTGEVTIRPRRHSRMGVIDIILKKIKDR